MDISKDLAVLLDTKGYNLYPASLRSVSGGKRVFTAVGVRGKVFGIVQKGEDGRLSSPISSYMLDLPSTGEKVDIYPLSWENYEKLKGLMPIAPVKCDKKASFGTGDRLGLVSAAHLGVLGCYPVFPVISQQSPRELQKANRTFKDVLLKAVMGVLESGYIGGYGADADHIKSEDYLQEGLEAGFSMYTLDASDWLEKIGSLSDSDIRDRAEKLSFLSRDIVKDCEDRKVALPSGDEFSISEEEMVKSAIIFEKAMEWVGRCRETISAKLNDFDLEVSIDESDRTTTPEDHLFVVEYLHRSGIDFSSLAPRFPGEFQKAVDYRGDVNELTRSLQIQTALAKESGGYRLSLHSGSDKFSVYKLFADTVEGNFHVKTSGTSWLEAVEVIAEVEPELFARLYELCVESLDESKKAYHVSITTNDFPKELPADLMVFYSKPDVRQLFHISYGVLLDAERSRIFETLEEYEKKHYAAVSEHIGRHLDLLFEA